VEEIQTETTKANNRVDIVKWIIAKKVLIGINLHNYVNGNVYKKTQAKVEDNRSQRLGLPTMQQDD
jgi:hypothetical protein